MSLIKKKKKGPAESLVYLQQNQYLQLQVGLGDWSLKLQQTCTFGFKLKPGVSCESLENESSWVEQTWIKLHTSIIQCCQRVKNAALRRGSRLNPQNTMMPFTNYSQLRVLSERPLTQNQRATFNLDVKVFIHPGHGLLLLLKLSSWSLLKMFFRFPLDWQIYRCRNVRGVCFVLLYSHTKVSSGDTSPSASNCFFFC